ncbi:hypothetical protein Dda_8462 [Drechslerella dactyloides]|uniref:Uncharacterized protein n=1 Tax=Drechslerella dactyloides TaxID=74499 RepID=A0AAD6NFW0_DREDA|nr:hypothetical protein Dda_8462 [Drechslerella dactyloides]
MQCDAPLLLKAWLTFEDVFGGPFVAAVILQHARKSKTPAQTSSSAEAHLPSPISHLPMLCYIDECASARRRLKARKEFLPDRRMAKTCRPAEIEALSICAYLQASSRTHDAGRSAMGPGHGRKQRAARAVEEEADVVRAADGMVVATLGEGPPSPSGMPVSLSLSARLSCLNEA